MLLKATIFIMDSPETKRQRTDYGPFPKLITFSSYFLAWLSVSDKKYKDASERIAVHEKLICRKDFDEGSDKDDIRRIFFVEEDRKFSFGFICDEYGSQSVSYLAYLESTTGWEKTSMTKPFIRAYAEYMSLISSGKWRLHIWADPPDNNQNNYLFRNCAPKPQDKRKDANALRDLYAGLLKESGFEVSPYEWKLPSVPPLPTFGKKGESTSIAKFRRLTLTIYDLVDDFNSLFENTCCAILKQPNWIEIPPPSHFIQRDELTDFEYWSSERICTDSDLDFSVEHAEESTLKLIKKMGNNCGRFEDYYPNSLSKIRSSRKKRLLDLFQNLVRAVRDRPVVENNGASSNK